MPTFTADTTTGRIAKYGADDELTRTFEYCEKAVTADAYNGTRIELLIDLLIRDERATIVDGQIAAPEIVDLPIGMEAIRTKALMDALQEANERGEAHPWIVDELAHLREFLDAVTALGATTEFWT